MADAFCYGDTFHLFNETTFDQAQGAGYLDVNTDVEPPQPGHYRVFAAATPLRSGKSGTWQIVPLDASKAGKQVQSGDTVLLRSMLDVDGEMWLGAFNVPGLAPEGDSVWTSAKSDDTMANLKWKIANAAGSGLCDGDTVHVSSCLDASAPTYLDTYGRAGVAGEVYNVYTSPTPERSGYKTGSWKIIRVSSAQTGGNPPVGNGTFTLPANIAFGVTALANSSSAQKVDIYVGSDNKPIATLQGGGTQDGYLGTKVLNSGNGNVRVVVTANGRTSPVVSSRLDIPLPGGKTLSFGLVGSEDSTDNDYNDGIVMLNWPLG